jgi:hypothetical protein
MKKRKLTIIFIFIFLNNLIFTNLYSKIDNTILIKVGESLITSLDVQNEIVTNLVINKKEINQENINNSKQFAIKNLINKSIKKSEINKYKIEDYSKKDLQKFLERVAKNLDTNKNELEEIFKLNNIDYLAFIEKHKTELLWNTLIYNLYRNQTNVNIIDIDNEIEKTKENKTEEEIKKLKKELLYKKKEEKLNLFSRSHFSNLENTISINFQ